MGLATKILAPTDLSELSLAGLRYALEMTRDGEAEVIVYNVITREECSIPLELSDWVDAHRDIPRVSEMIERRKATLATFLRAHFGDPELRSKIRAAVDTGSPHKRILEKAAEEGVDLIVMSTHGRTGLLHILVGSVTEKVVRGAGCPVLTVRPAGKVEAGKAVA